MMSTPIETLRLSPPDTPLVPSSPICSISFSTRPLLSALEIDPSLKSAANMSVSYTVSIGNSLSSCIIYADVLLIKLGLTSTPSNATLPMRLPLAIRPAKPSKKVDFPAPLGPITAVMHPFEA
ncbi:hypothetical protein ACJIZ3_003373 [Penstemon smallii]|uniref:Uncharacterized protein n=1 Tax=Penstemon smallii TaxID=265156 RepID=A0ABD3UAH6_9LAMI